MKDAFAIDILVSALCKHFEAIREEGMHEVSSMNPRLRIESCGFQWEEDASVAGGRVAAGVLIAPWVMSLIRIPAQATGWPAGRVCERQFGSGRFEFVAQSGGASGCFESSKLSSPMLGVETQAQARDTAQAVLARLRPGLEAEGPSLARRAFMWLRTPSGGMP